MTSHVACWFADVEVPMPAIFEWTHTVADADLDGLGHANNISYLKWMQSAALGHSAIQGWPAEAYAQLGCGWVVRTHFIEYLSPALRGDQLVVQTWVADMKKVTSMRRFRIQTTRGGDPILLARAETNWAFVDYQTGVPKRIPSQVSASFEIADVA
jgi:acyl-CoA thioester hydrolase